MLFITVALHAEARPLIKSLKLKMIPESGKPVIYERNDVKLIISGTGKMKSAIATASSLGSLNNYREVLAVNIGICGSPPTINRGDLFLVNKIKDYETGKSYYPDLLLQNEIEEAEIVTFNRPVLDGGYANNTLIDMEASGFWEAAATFLPPSQILLFKVVSDHMDNQPVTKEGVYHLINEKVESLLGVIKMWQSMLHAKNRNPLNGQEIKLLKKISNSLKLTVTQQRQLDRMALLFKIRTQQSLEILTPFLDRKVNSKFERNGIFDEIKRVFVQS